MRIPILVAVLYVATLLAGCTSDSSSGAASGDGSAAPPPESGKGQLRGVVVDEAIRPLAKATVVLTRGNLRMNTTEAGNFFFNNLDPGTYFVIASKVGFNTVQQSAEVVADVPEPPVVRIQLQSDPTTKPYAVGDKWNGYLECALSVIALCGALPSGTTQDNFAHVVPIDRPPSLIQSEVQWTTTTAASDQLWLWHSKGVAGSGAYNGSCNCWAQGTSPLIMVTNQTGAKSQHYGTSNWLYLRMFTGSIQGTRNPTNPEGCYPGPPAGDIFCGGVGWSIEQPFTVYTYTFYGFLPPKDWTFGKLGEAKPPA